jgi:hypothetical protein
MKDTTKLNKIFIVTLNKDYLFKDKLNIKELFSLLMLPVVKDLADEVDEKMREAVI